MRSRKEIEEFAIGGKKQMATLEVLLDIRDILEKMIK